VRPVPGARTLSWRLWRLWDVLHGSRCRLDRPIFIVGCPRSGTTVFLNNFATHPALAGLNDTTNIWDPNLSNPEVDHVRTDGDITPAVRRRLRAMYSLYVWLCGAERLVDKLPRNALRVPYLHALFPNCFVIHVIRDGRAVVASLMALNQRDMSQPTRQGIPFGGFAKPPGWRELLDLPPVEQFAHLWARLVPYARASGSQLPPGTYTEVFYEEFCRDPQGILSRLYEWCGLPPHRRLSQVIPPALQPRNDKWRTTLAPTDQARLVAIVGSLLTELGYRQS
jgi:Sulfotransferase family